MRRKNIKGEDTYFKENNYILYDVCTKDNSCCNGIDIYLIFIKI